MLTMSLAQRVRDYRYSKGWGPDELASRAAISRTALYQIESGKTELPRAGTLRRIALALDVSMETLLGHVADGGAGASAAAGRRSRSQGEWMPSEGGPLAMPPGRLAPTLENPDGSRFGIEAPSQSQPQTQPHAAPATAHDSLVSARERELAWKLHELLASPLGEGIARILEESHRLLPQSRLHS
jgi:transcriptional regulator with XRE-family HTH domain